MQTRKHFIAAAELISRIENPAERKALAEHNATLFAKDNPRFDKARFMAACNVENP